MDLLILLGTGALLARVGLALYATGLSRSKNASGAAARSLFDLCVAALAFWAIGAAILFQQHNGLIGVRPGLILGWSISTGTAGIVFFYTAAVLLASAALVGTLAERSKFFPVCAASVLLAGVLVPVIGKWAWTGWLHNLGFIDVAGASVLHLTAGVCATVGAVLVGARNGKYHRDGSASMIPGHNVPLAASGVMLVVAGWVPCVAGFAVLAGVSPAQAALNVLLAGAAGGAAAVSLGRFRYGKPDVTLALLGFLGGLVAITASAGRVGMPAAVVIGAVAGVIVPLASVYIDLILRIDDPAGSISVHAVGGLWGTLVAGILVPAGSNLVRLKQFGVQLLGVIAIIAFAALLSVAVMYALKKAVGIRAKEADEFDGLDLAEHDIGAYPDFQQTTIKSYHLREA